MSDNDLLEIVRKLEYQVSIIGHTIDYDKHPVESLILNMNWGPGDIGKAHDIFERWDNRLERGEKIDRFKFEGEFEEVLGVSYQALKSIVIAFYENGQWSKVCEAYVDSFGSAPAVEYHRIMRRER